MNISLNKEIASSPLLPQHYTLTFASQLNSVLVYGHLPTAQPQDKKKRMKPQPLLSEQIHLYSLTNKSWSTHQLKGKLPSRRSHFSTTYLHPNLILFGGRAQSDASKVHNDVYALSTKTYVWKKLFSLEAPPPNPNSIMMRITATQLAVFADTLWLLQLKDINWEMGASQLPGALWVRINISLPPQISCGTCLKGQIILFSDNFSVAYRIVVGEQIAQEIGIDGIKKCEGSSVCFALNDREILLINESREIINYRLEENILVATDHIKCEDFYFKLKMAKVLTEGTYHEFFCMTVKNEPVVLEIEAKDQTRNNFCIIEECNEESGMYSKENSEKENSQREVVDKSMQHPLMQQRLKLIHAHQYVKRKILEKKSKILEQSIKKTQKMVFVLFKYSSEEDKIRHIERVKYLRNELQSVWNKEMRLKKEIEARANGINVEEEAADCVDKTLLNYIK